MAAEQQAITSPELRNTEAPIDMKSAHFLSLIRVFEEKIPTGNISTPQA